jgi:hypothetical protein
MEIGSNSILFLVGANHVQDGIIEARAAKHTEFAAHPRTEDWYQVLALVDVLQSKLPVIVERSWISNWLK